MSWESPFGRHVPRLNHHRLIGNTDPEIIIQEASGMRQLDDTVPGGFGWRGPVASL